jgi:membrane AbrB-like protein
LENLTNLFLYLGAGFLGGMAGLQLRLPGSVIIGSMLAVIITKVLTQSTWTAHGHFNLAIQILVGVIVGTRYSPDLGKMLIKVLLPVMCSTLVLVSAGLVVSIVLVKLNLLNIPTAYLSTSPGAFSALITLSLDSQAESSIVAAFHFFRVVFILITAPVVFRAMQYFFGR